MCCVLTRTMMNWDHPQVTFTAEKLIVEPFWTPKDNFGLQQMQLRTCSLWLRFSYILRYCVYPLFFLPRQLSRLWYCDIPEYVIIRWHDLYTHHHWVYLVISLSLYVVVEKKCTSTSQFSSTSIRIIAIGNLPIYLCILRYAYPKIFKFDRPEN